MKIKILIALILVFFSSEGILSSAPVIDLEKTVLNLGCFCKGTALREKIWISNSGDTSLIISPAEASPNIFIETGEFIIPPGEKKFFAFSILMRGEEDTYLRLHTNDPDSPDIKIFFIYSVMEPVLLYPHDFINIEQYPGSRNVYRAYLCSIFNTLEIKDLTKSNEHLHAKALDIDHAPTEGIKSSKEIIIAYSEQIQPGSYMDFLAIETNHGRIVLNINTSIKPLINVLPLGAHFQGNSKKRQPFLIHLINSEKSDFNVSEAVFDRGIFDISIRTGEDDFVKILEIMLKKIINKPGVYHIELMIDEERHPYIDIPVYID